MVEGQGALDFVFIDFFWHKPVWMMSTSGQEEIDFLVSLELRWHGSFKNINKRQNDGREEGGPRKKS